MSAASLTVLAVVRGEVHLVHEVDAGRRRRLEEGWSRTPAGWWAWWALRAWEAHARAGGPLQPAAGPGGLQRPPLGLGLGLGLGQGLELGLVRLGPPHQSALPGLPALVVPNALVRGELLVALQKQGLIVAR